MQLSEISLLLDKGQSEEAIRQVEAYEGTRDLEFWFLAAKAFSRQQKWANAINACLKVLEKDPGNKDAQVMMELAKSILEFKNEGMFNV
jgi:tetratricopeptide (TPR) repeat protein